MGLTGAATLTFLTIERQKFPRLRIAKVAGRWLCHKQRNHDSVTLHTNLVGLRLTHPTFVAGGELKVSHSVGDCVLPKFARERKRWAASVRTRPVMPVAIGSPGIAINIFKRWNVGGC